MNKDMIQAMSAEECERIHGALTDICYFIERYYDGPSKAASDKEYLYYMRIRKQLRDHMYNLVIEHNDGH